MKNKSLKLIGLGITLMLVGIYVNLEIGLGQYLRGKEFFIVLAGAIISIIGFLTDFFFDENADK